MRIESIAIKSLPPFADVKFTLPEPERSAAEGSRKLGEVQLFTGPNGTGKSRLLAGVAACAGYVHPLAERMGKWKGKSGTIIVGGLGHTMNDELFKIVRPGQTRDEIAKRREMFARADVATVAAVSEGPIATVAKIPEDRLLFARSPGAWLKHTPVTFMQSVPEPTEAERLSFVPEEGHGKNLLQTIANVKAKSLNDFQKHMGKPGAKRSKMEQLIGDLESALTDFFGVRVFFRTDAETSSLLIDWGEIEEMTVSQAPDGLRSVLGWLVDIIMMTHLLRPESPNPMHEEMVILLDEPETHLHPAWQRKIIPLAQRLLPNAQMLVATHSPFVVMSVNEGWIHRLEMQADGMVRALEPMKASPGDSYPFVTDVVMGVPEWFDPESERMLKDFKEWKQRALSGDAGAMREALKTLDRLTLRGEEMRGIAEAERLQLQRLEATSKDPDEKPAAKRKPRKRALA